MLKIIGIDPGIVKTGISILQYNNRSFTLLDTHTISTKSTSNLPERIFTICQSIKPFLKEVNLIGIETSFVNLTHKNYASSIKLANLYGALLYTIYNYIEQNPDKHFVELQPNKIKKYTTGAGHATKQSMHSFLKTIIKDFKTNNLHESDAIAIAYTTGLILTNKNY